MRFSKKDALRLGSKIDGSTSHSLRFLGFSGKNAYDTLMALIEPISYVLFRFRARFTISPILRY